MFVIGKLGRAPWKGKGMTGGRWWSPKREDERSPTKGFHFGTDTGDLDQGDEVGEEVGLPKATEEVSVILSNRPLEGVLETILATKVQPERPGSSASPKS